MKNKDLYCTRPRKLKSDKQRHSWKTQNIKRKEFWLASKLISEMPTGQDIKKG